MSAVLTNLYLEAPQRRLLEARASKRGTSLSSEARAAIDLYKADVSLPELELLDAATQRAKTDLDAITAVYDKAERRAKKFFAQIKAIKADTSAQA
ncbi:MAG: hypothetical protein LBH10_01320 [Burkholderiaceae bacterium]|nr:hypothetical protein [Burkholderiaceae bacterium]